MKNSYINNVDQFSDTNIHAVTELTLLRMGSNRGANTFNALSTDHFHFPGPLLGLLSVCVLGIIPISPFLCMQSAKILHYRQKDQCIEAINWLYKSGSGNTVLSL